MTGPAWVRINGTQSQSYVAALEDSGKAFVLGINGAQAFASMSTGGAPTTATQTGSSLSTGDWHHLVARAGNGLTDLFVDGVAAGSATTTIPDIGGTLTVGGSAQGGNFLAAELDEL